MSRYVCHWLADYLSVCPFEHSPACPQARLSDYSSPCLPDPLPFPLSTWLRAGLPARPPAWLSVCLSACLACGFLQGNSSPIIQVKCYDRSLVINLLSLHNHWVPTTTHNVCDPDVNWQADQCHYTTTHYRPLNRARVKRSQKGRNCEGVAG